MIAVYHYPKDLLYVQELTLFNLNERPLAPHRDRFAPQNWPLSFAVCILTIWCLLVQVCR